MARAQRGYDGIPAAERRAARRAALLNAALDLISESGAAAVSKRSVCARARLNDRYFYEHFADRDALLRTLGEELTAGGLRSVLNAMVVNDSSVDARVRGAVRAALDYFDADPRRGRMLLSSAADPILQAERQSSIRAIVDATVGLTPLLFGPQRPADEEVELTAYLLVSGSIELLAAWLRGELPVSRSEIEGAIAEQFSAAAERVAMDFDPRRP